MITPYHFPRGGKMVLSASRQRVTEFERTPIGVNAVFSSKPRLVGDADDVGTQRPLYSRQYGASIRNLTRRYSIVVKRPAVGDYMQLHFWI